MNKQVKKTIFIMAILSLIALSSCSSQDEPKPESTNPAYTRSAQSTSAHTYSVDEAKNIANRALERLETNPKNIDAKAIICNDKSKINELLSDTVAFVINYPEDKGFVIVANDSRAEQILAYSETGRLAAEDNPIVKCYFLDKIGDYLISLKNNNNQDIVSGNISQAITKRIIIEPRIVNEIGPFSPFDKVVIKEHPTCHAGFMNVASINIITNTLKNLIYKGYRYNFESINYALAQGEGYFGGNPDIGIQSNEEYTYFINSYDGAVSAIAQLLYSIGKSCGTFYPNGSDRTWTWYPNVPPVLESIGLTVSETYTDKNLDTIYNLLNDGYFVEMFGSAIKNGGGLVDISFLRVPGGWVADGCDVMVNQQNEILSGMLHCVWGFFGLGDGFYSFPVLLADDEQHLETYAYFGVKGDE